MFKISEGVRCRAVWALCGSLALTAASSGVAFAHFTGYDSVDHSTREIRYTESSKYDAAISYAVGQWDSLGRIAIRSGQPNVTLQIVDYYDATTSTRGSCCGGDPDTMKLNTAQLDTPGCGGRPIPDGQKATVTHEFGHALGLAHSFLPNVMHMTCTGARALTPQSHDREDYFALWPAAMPFAPTAEGGTESAFDPRDTRRLVGFASHVFVGTVRGKAGDKGLPTSDPDVEIAQQQYKVDVLTTLKGKLDSEVAVNQPEDEQGEESEDLRSGETYLFVTRRNSDEDWYTLVAPGFSVVDASSSRRRREAITKFEQAVNEQIPFER